ncbi:tyrosine-type recombinase/integrase [Sporosarcina sp. BP05]|uniref:tyrosine-type recombinase/integrase n=1 Tax=Sporosarcina sp. BP05 TaxID=2758726 RepID=UPI0016493391|nr:tyrosine-type recombinase/integrase [Sporosarcina sp. BP05]
MKALDDKFFKVVRDYLTIYLPRQKAYSTNTIKAYAETINLLRLFLEKEKHIRFTEITFSLLNKNVISEYLDWVEEVRGCSVTTRNYRLTVMKAFYKYAAMENPALIAPYMELKKIPAKKTIKTPVNYLSEKALNVLLTQPDTGNMRGIRNQFLMIFLYDTGARIQELLNLRIKDISLQSEVPFVYLTGKGQKTRAVPLQEKTIRHLNKYLSHFHPQKSWDTEKYLFFTVIHGQHSRMSEDNVAAFLKKYAKSAKEKFPEIPDRVYPHLFRHTKAMHLYQAGIPLSYIKDFLGHSNINTTDRYAFADVSMMKKALEKVSKTADILNEKGIWDDNEELILKLCGLK